jgi:hypothetical protein
MHMYMWIRQKVEATSIVLILMKHEIKTKIACIKLKFKNYI